MPVKNQTARTAVFRLSTFLPYKLGVVTDSASRVFAEYYLDSFNLTIPEWRALAVVAEHGTISPTAVGQYSAMDKVKVSRATQSLVRKGLLRQARDPSDGRGRLLRLTRKGITTHAGMVPLATELEAGFFGELSRADIAALGRILSKIISHLETTALDGPETD